MVIFFTVKMFSVSLLQNTNIETRVDLDTSNIPWECQKIYFFTMYPDLGAYFELTLSRSLFIMSRTGVATVTRTVTRSELSLLFWFYTSNQPNHRYLNLFRCCTAYRKGIRYFKLLMCSFFLFAHDVLQLLKYCKLVVCQTSGDTLNFRRPSAVFTL